MYGMLYIMSAIVYMEPVVMVQRRRQSAARVKHEVLGFLVCGRGSSPEKEVKMNRQQRIAWSQLAFVGGAAVFCAVATGYFIWKYRYTGTEAWWLAVSYTAPLLILAIILPPVIFRTRRGGVGADERDLMIDHIAATIAFSASFVFFVGVCMVTWLAVGVDSMIPAAWLTRIVYMGWVTAIAANALTIVICYGRPSKADA